MKQQTLTKGETQVMNILWSMGKGACVNDILLQYPEPKPAYTTIATFLKILEQKGFVERRKGNSGKQMVYTPLMTKERYRRLVMDDVKQTFFDGSVASLVSFFAEEEDLSQDDIKEILTILQSRKADY